MLRYCCQHHIQSLTENSNTDGIRDLCNYFSIVCRLVCVLQISIGKKRKEKITSERQKAHKKIKKKKKKKHNRIYIYIYIYMKELSLAFLLLTATTRKQVE
ncbi:BnaA09g53880D [Brassica napus]|uniref:BnaA09g53880D protein n=1 Tax=Brassica napus TaxID=3708 RepID=A0A078GRN0_BRANA|nr:BnaA09g53880D [Brassica napus]